MKTILTNHGVDWNETMARFVNSEELYMECLEMLMQDESLPKLTAALKTGDLQTAFEAAHTLKGVAANMGLPALTGAASQLVEPLRNKTPLDYTPLLQTLTDEFENTRTLYHTLQNHLKGGKT